MYLNMGEWREATQILSTRGNWQCFGYHNCGARNGAGNGAGGATVILWAETKDASENCIIHRKRSPIGKNCPAQSPSSVKILEPWL